MALRELFAKFTFDWDQAALVKIEQATQAAESTVVKLAESINRVSQVVRAGTSPMQQYGLVQENGSLAASTLMRMHEQLLAAVNGVRSAVSAAVPTVEKLGAAEQAAGAKASTAAGGIDKAKHATHGLHGVVKEALAALGIFGGVFGAVFAGHALKEAIVGELEMADADAKLAQQLGVTVEGMQTLDTAAALSGVGTEQLRGSVMTLTRNLGLFAAMGKGRAKDVLKDMGLGIDDIENKKPEQLFWDFGKAIASIADPVKKSAYAQRIFGSEGTRLLALFKGTNEEIDAQRALADDLGVVWSEDFSVAAEETNDNLELLHKQFQRVKVGLIGNVLPALNWISHKLIVFGRTISDISRQTHAFQGAFIAGGWMLFVRILSRLVAGGGGVLGWVRKLWPLLLRIGRVLLPWLAWTLILDDIITYLQGGDSALGRLLDRLGGAGTAARVLDIIKEAWHSIGKAIVSAGETLGRWFDALGVKKETAIAGLIAIGLIGASGIGGITVSLIAMIARLVIGTAMWGAHAIAIWAANAAGQGFWMTLLNVGIALGAIMVAAGGLALMVDQFIKLKNEAGGLVGILKGLMSMAKGEGFFKGVDEAMNEQARKDAANRAALERDQTPAAMRAPMLPLRPELMPGQVPPMLARPGAGAPVAVTDNRTLTVNVTSPEMLRPEVVGRKIAGAVNSAQPALPNLRAAHGALAGAPHG